MEVKEKKKKFSDEQQSAIDTRDRTVLVSAAAGSGKTTTLTERIIQQLLDEDNPKSIGDMLIVTFTNASVYDLRKKIGEALTEASLLAPENKSLEAQLRSLEYARIMTIDSFCAEVVRTHAERLGITPAYRISETAETLILERTLLDSLIDAALRGELGDEIDAEKFERLCDALTGVKNTADLADIFITLYEKTKSMVKGVGIFGEFANNYLHYSQISLDDTPYGKYILEKGRDTATYYAQRLTASAGRLKENGDEKLCAFGDYLCEISESLSKIAHTCTSYSDMREKLAQFSCPKAPSIPNPKPPVAEAAIDVRDKMKKAIKKLYDDFFSYDLDEWKKLFIDSADYVGVLALFLDKFSTLFFEEKRRRAAIEFSDIERLAYDAFYNPDGSLTDVALEYRNGFEAIYIDEYQDVNELQNMIFSAVSMPDRKFMVGDIKQSIYGFRSARPEIFAKMKSAFPPLSAGYNIESAIFMSNNYRCDEGVIDFVNAVFDSLFGAVRESVGYVDADKLSYKKRYEGFVPEYEKCKICLIDKEDSDAETDDGFYDELDGEDDAEADKSNAQREAEFIADEITRLIKDAKRRDGSPITPGDVAIIMRRKNNFPIFEEALRARGIAVEAAEKRDFFLNKEILLTLSLLSAIDNPRKDIPLAALMCSPLYSFTADELYTLKTEGGESTLYDSLISYVKKYPDSPKVSSFISRLSHYRALCEGMSVDTLISRLYAETGLLSLASKNGGKENLYKLLSYAKSFEGSSYKGLYNFITYVNNLIEENAQIDKNDSASKNSNAVTIGTIHSSKGLEFPVVFVAECGAKLVNLDLRQKVAFDEDFGISFLMRGPGGLALVENPLKKAILDYMDAKFYEEIIRLLYVALTRAKEKLYVTATVSEPEKYLNDFYENRAELTRYSLRQLKSYMDMVCASGADADIIFQSSVNEEEKSEAVTAPIESDEKKEDGEYEKSVDELCEDLMKKFTFVYPDEHLTVMPEKMSVSRLSPRLLDGADEETKNLFDGENEKERREPTPKFISEDPVDKSAKRGIATHNFLQFFDIDSLVANGAQKELKRLTDKGFISEKNAALVRKDELGLFERSELFGAMKDAKRLYREFRFNTRLPAEYFAENENAKALYKDSFVLVQGVIDCLIENADGSLRLIDYKTDRLSKEELSDESLARETLNRKHAQQLSYYALAVERIFGKRPEVVEVYSLPLGKTVKIDIKF
ncbi:MAG: UvrD-helicase domain-containing protein [Clostridia bacterium]|nr:UvrD-helicase domain-containing protein [Clostridia bacterium]